MATHKLHDEAGDFYIAKSGNFFYVNTVASPGGDVPGPVSSFSYIGDEPVSCNDTTTISFSWTAPADNGGSPITGYSIRRIFASTNSTQDSPISGLPTASINDFQIFCGGGGNGVNPITVGNITSIAIDDWNCDHYSFQIAAINANGMGPYYPSSGADLLLYTIGWASVGSDAIGYNTSGGNIAVTYSSSQGGCPYVNYQNTSGDLIPFDGSTPVASYSSYSPGTLSFTKPTTPGWYYVRVYETWTDYTNNCTEERTGCLKQPIYIE